MARRLKRHELLNLLAQTREELQDLEPQYPLPSAEQDREAALQHRSAWGLHRGRLHAVYRAARCGAGGVEGDCGLSGTGARLAGYRTARAGTRADARPEAGAGPRLLA